MISQWSHSNFVFAALRSPPASTFDFHQKKTPAGLPMISQWSDFLYLLLWDFPLLPLLTLIKMYLLLWDFPLLLLLILRQGCLWVQEESEELQQGDCVVRSKAEHSKHLRWWCYKIKSILSISDDDAGRCELIPLNLYDPTTQSWHTFRNLALKLRLSGASKPQSFLSNLPSILAS